MKQTATEWLREKLRLEFGFVFSDNIMEQAKEMEKEQICNAFEHVDYNLDDGLHYYNETFNK